jgi:hypothetical protein
MTAALMLGCIFALLTSEQAFSQAGKKSRFESRVDKPVTPGCINRTDAGHPCSWTNELVGNIFAKEVGDHVKGRSVNDDSGNAVSVGARHKYDKQ